MKVYVVKTLWRTDNDFGSDIKLFKSKDKARRYYSKEVVNLMNVYNIEIGDEKLDISNDWDTEYCTGDWDYFNIFIYEELI